ncbi:MAG: MBL fold metallo-hydrolase [Alphaproteobacteria bacterium]|nr:MBL fold metallo-hydrolase [Alphaproteobacteria bacterium]
MKWLVRLGVVALLLVAAYWFEVLDGGVPSTSTYKTDIAGWRQLVAGDSGQLPTEVRIEFIGRDTMPFIAVQGGGENKDFARTRASFQLDGAAGSVVIDTAFNKEIAAKAQRVPFAFDEAAYARMISVMGVASVVAVTHEHMDHIGGVMSFPLPERLAERLVFTKQQFEGFASASKQQIPPAYAAMPHLDLTAPTRIAPGVVMIPAPGHTPGSALFYVRMADGHELLFIGDVAWAISNIRTPAMRPRFVEQFFMSGEDRAAVGDEVRALHDLSAADPALVIIPAHDEAYLRQLIAQGLLKEHFQIDGP